MMAFISNPERIFWLSLIAVAGWAAATNSAPTTLASAPPEGAALRPVLVELFTSEGCSSCPPADALIARLDQSQFVPGAQAIVLSEHVTYWNQDGWQDPFSLDAVTQRQKDYADRFRLQSPYTPEVVVDGATELVGSDERKLTSAVAQAAAAPKTELVIQDAQWEGKAVRFSVKSAGDSKAVLVAALAEDSAQSSVARGENKGRTLRHVAVVQAMEEMSKGATDGRPLTVHAPLGSYTGPLRLVVFLADRHNGHVLAVTERTIPR
jgi:hypothetical protein